MPKCPVRLAAKSMNADIEISLMAKSRWDSERSERAATDWSADSYNSSSGGGFRMYVRAHSKRPDGEGTNDQDCYAGVPERNIKRRDAYRPL